MGLRLLSCKNDDRAYRNYRSTQAPESLHSFQNGGAPLRGKHSSNAVTLPRGLVRAVRAALDAMGQEPDQLTLLINALRTDDRVRRFGTQLTDRQIAAALEQARPRQATEGYKPQHAKPAAALHPSPGWAELNRHIAATLRPPG